MSRVNLALRHGSPVPGLRLRSHRGYVVVDATRNVGGRRCSTTYLCRTAGPIAAIERAMQYRRAAGAVYDITPRQAWNRLRKHYRL